MRFLKGWFGAWAGLGVGMLIIGLITGTVGRQLGDMYSFGMINLIFSAVGASVTCWFEKETWSWKAYATMGGAITGGLIMGFFTFFAMSLAAAGVGGLSFAEFAMAALYAAIAGAFSGLGYMLLTR